MTAPRRLQLRRGNSTAISSYTGAAGELVVNTTNWSLRLHDGSTVGGYVVGGGGGTLYSDSNVFSYLTNTSTTLTSLRVTTAAIAQINGTNPGSELVIQTGGLNNFNFRSSGNLEVPGSIIPTANVAYSLGNITHQWNDLFVSNNTIFVGGVPLGIDATGNLTVNGTVIPTIGYVNTVVANVTVDLSSYALNANVTAANVGLKGYVDLANTIQSAQLTSANLGVIGYIDLANTIQSAQVGAANLAITAANLGMRGYVDNQITTITGGAPAILDTLGELANALGADANLSVTITSQIANVNANITTANLGMRGYVDSQTFYSNARVATYLQVGGIGNISVAGNVTATYFVGNGALLTGIAASSNYSNVQVAAYLSTATINTTGNITAGNLFTSGALYVANITTTGASGNISGANYITANYFVGNGALLTGLSSSYSNVQVATYLPTYTGVVTASNVAVNGNVTATYFVGNGALLTGIVGGASNYGNIDVKAFLGTDAGFADGYQRVIEGYYANIILGDTTKLFSYGSSSKSYFGHEGSGNTQINYVRADNGDVRIATNNGAYNWIFDNTGNLTLPGATAGETIATSGGYITVGNLLIGQGGSLFNSNNDSWALYGNRSDAGTSITIPSNDSAGNGQPITIENQISNVEIVSSNNTWTFGTDAVLTLPSGATILESGYGSAGTIRLKPNGGTSTQYLEIAPTTVDGNHVHLMAGSGTELFLGDDNHYVKLANTGGVVINSNDGAGNTAQWTFGTDGTTTFPTNISIDYSGGNVLYPRIIAGSGTTFSVQGQGNIGSAALAWTADPNAASQYASVGVARVGDNLAKVVLLAMSDSADVATAKIWQFNETGTTQFPNSLILAPVSQSITMQSDQYSQLMWENANLTVAPNMAINSNFYVAQNNATLDIGYRDGSSTQIIKSWYWNADGNLKLPSGGYILNSDDSIYGGDNYSNVQVATYLPTYTGNIANIRLGTSGVLTFADGTTQITAGGAGGTNYSNVNVAAYVTTNGLTNYSNVNVKAYTESMGFKNYSNVNVAAYLATATITTTGNITAQNLIGNISITGNVTGTSSNVTLQAGAYTSVFDNQGNVTVPQLFTAGNVQTAGYLFGNGAFLTGIVAGSSYSNVQVATYLPTYSGVVGASNVFVSGNVTAQYFLGNGALLTGIASSYSNVQVATYLPTYTGNVANVRLGTSGILTFPDGTQQTTAAFGGGGNYGNANVAAFLPTYTGTTGITQIGTLATLSVTGNATVGNLVGTEANTRIIANTYVTTFDIYGNVSFPANVIATNFVGSGSLLSGVAIKTTGSWTVPTGNSTQSFTVTSGTYQLWVECNIPNGILAWNATATVTNSNVPVVGQQFAWVYNGGGTPIDFTSIPNQFVGTGNTIVRNSTAPSATTNRFDFGISNTSGGNVTVSYGYVKIS